MTTSFPDPSTDGRMVSPPMLSAGAFVGSASTRSLIVKWFNSLENLWRNATLYNLLDNQYRKQKKQSYTDLCGGRVSENQTSAEADNNFSSFTFWIA